MPPMPGTAPAAAAAQPQGPHPWESQLNAARNRAEQTEVQYLNPDQDPLRRRPRRQPAPPTAPPAAQQQQPQQQPYGQQQQQQPPQQPYRQPQPPPQQQQQPRYQQPQPQRYEPQRPPPAEPAPRREPRQRSANPVKIPGLGCLKGCFTMILVLVVIFLLAWYVGPLQDWFNTGKGLWASVSDWVTTAWDWVSTIGDAASNAPSGLPGQGGGPGGQ
jgi:serine/threonine-protein kinase